MSEVTRATNLACLLGKEIKAGRMTRLMASNILRTAFGLDLRTAIFLVDTGIDNANGVN